MDNCTDAASGPEDPGLAGKPDPAGDRVDISVIICSYNGHRRLPGTLEHLFAQTRTPREIILVDNNSSDGTGDVARQIAAERGRELTVIHEPVQGTVYARIAGIRAAAGELLCYVDDDNHLAPDYLEQAAAIFRDFPATGYAGGHARPQEGAGFPAWFPLVAPDIYAVGAQARENGPVRFPRRIMRGAGLVIRRAPLLALLDAGYRFRNVGHCGAAPGCGEDSEMCYMMSICGYGGFYSDKLVLSNVIDPKRLNKSSAVSQYCASGKAMPAMAYFWLCANSSDRMNRMYIVKYIFSNSRIFFHFYCAARIFSFYVKRMFTTNDESRFHLNCKILYWKSVMSSPARISFRHFEEEIRHVAKKARAAIRAPSPQENSRRFSDS